MGATGSLAPDDPGHAVRQYLDVLDEAAFGSATPVVPKFISGSDPASRWTGANGGLAFFACQFLHGRNLLSLPTRRLIRSTE